MYETPVSVRRTGLARPSALDCAKATVPTSERTVDPGALDELGMVGQQIVLRADDDRRRGGVDLEGIAAPRR